MKIEMDDNTSIITTLIAGMVFLAVVTLSGCHMTEETARTAIKAGLVQKDNQSRNGGIIWTRP